MMFYSRVRYFDINNKIKRIFLTTELLLAIDFVSTGSGLQLKLVQLTYCRLPVLVNCQMDDKSNCYVCAVQQ